jgi:outer membrane protein TolC
VQVLESFDNRPEPSAAPELGGRDLTRRAADLLAWGPTLRLAQRHDHLLRREPARPQGPPSSPSGAPSAKPETNSNESRRATDFGDVAIAYLDLRELDQELEIAKNTTAAFQDTYDLFQRRLEGGAASALETARAEASLAQVAAQIPEIERAIVARENQVNFLLGRNPQPIPREGPLLALPPDVPPGLPSTLLERRPDIRQAEQLLIAANAGVGVAKADFFPRLSLTGLFGAVSPQLGSLFDSNSKTWSVGAGLLGPLFLGGRIKHGYEAAQQQLFPAEIGLAETRRDQLVAVVDLYRALGGGWEAEGRALGGVRPQQEANLLPGGDKTRR